MRELKLSSPLNIQIITEPERMCLAYDALIMYCKEHGYKWMHQPPSPLGEYWFVLPKEELF